jgi:hypothetical protein
MTERDDSRTMPRVVAWLVGAWLVAAALCFGVAHGLEINKNQDGYESPIEAVYSIRDSTGLSLPLTLDFWAPQESDIANLDLWLHGPHVSGDGTVADTSWAKACQDTLRIGRVYR